MNKLSALYLTIVGHLAKLDFIPLLALRLYLAPIFIMAGWHKLNHFESMVAWFGNADWGLGLPFAPLMVALAIFAELVGGVALVFGIFTRFFALILSVAMLVAIKSVHLEHGWHAITPTDPNTSIAQLFSFLPQGQASLDNSVATAERLARAKELLQTHGNYEWLSETGNFVVLNNGVEFGVTYLIMLLVLIIYGAGRFFSVDYLLKYRLLRHKK